MADNNFTSTMLRARIPGVGIFFDEGGTFRYGLVIDLSKFEREKCDLCALSERFRARLMEEYDRLAPHIETARKANDPDIPQSYDGDAVGMHMPFDELMMLEIIPTAIDRTTLDDRLPGAIGDFMEWLQTGMEDKRKYS
ncbi:hypothetical protein PQR66_19355 [Paraburkholderia agricolaris]|uniref:Uncharacterized protein n=1 Tax=Paraburkholderia agricolaris TaxID=2152888 RepID=A0ABW8ZSR6_9BURK